MIYLSVDSIEDGYATCEDDNRDKWEINIKKLPNGIKEGDVVLIKDDGKILIDDKEKNVIEWNNAGGIGVLFTDADVSDNLTSVKSLEFLKKIKWNKNIKIVNYFSKFYYVNI